MLVDMVEKANDILKPQLRFPEYREYGTWSSSKLDDLVNVIVPPRKIPTSEYKEKGMYPIVDQSQNYICGWTDDRETLVFDDLPLIVFGDHTCIVKLIHEPFAQGADGIKILKAKDIIDSVFLYYAISFNPVIMEEYRRHYSILKEKMIFYPSIPEQQKIADCFSSIDEMISRTQEKIDLLRQYKKGLMQKMFPAKGKDLPELRFKEFEKDGAWNVAKLGDLTFAVNSRNKSNKKLPIYSISNKDGFVLQSELFDGLDSVKRGYDTSLYKIVGEKTFVYNPARINVGSIGYSGHLSEIAVSSLYVCFKTNEKVDDDFLMCYFNSSRFCNEVEGRVEGGIRSYLFYENFAEIRVAFPSIEEQRKIAQVMVIIDNEISLYSEKLNSFKECKIGLLQKLFIK